MRCPNCAHAIEDRAILSHAAKLRSKMRKTHGGGAPLKTFVCRYCGESCIGRAQLEVHEATHIGPPVEIGPEDLVPWDDGSAA